MSSLTKAVFKSYVLNLTYAADLDITMKWSYLLLLYNKYRIQSENIHSHISTVAAQSYKYSCGNKVMNGKVPTLWAEPKFLYKLYRAVNHFSTLKLFYICINNLIKQIDYKV